MAKTPTIAPTKLQKPQPDPFNLQAEKRYVFNETGNIMMASTEIGSEEISQEVRDVFAEVSVYFAAMTRAMSTTINPKTGSFYSIYDYEAIEGIVAGSGLFIQVSEEDITHEMSSWGVTVSKELIEGLLGLATGSGEMAFAQAMVSSIGKRGLQISGKNNKSDGRVGTIVFVCEYLMGMPVVSALVCYVDSKIASQSFTLGPCIKEQSSSLHLLLHKDTYMFVTPKFIRKYAGDLLSVESDLEYLELVDFLQDLVERKPTVTAVETPAGNPAPTTLTPNQPYFILGAFLNEVTGIDPKSDPKIEFTVDFDGGESIPAANPQSNVVGFTPTQPMSKATPATIVAHITTGTAPHQKTTKQNIVTTGTAFMVAAPSNTPQISGVFDSGNTKMTGNLSVGQNYSIKGSHLLGGHPAGHVSVEVEGSSPQAVSLVGTPTDSEVSFKVDHAFSSKSVTIMAGSTKLAATSRMSAT
ncbi:hypothetical protein [uncultured Ruegeria sp.]|uniref:hypothetical protein n=1 Tax=uncultured Ruegeria sp. TaxID=259304 RepID=UPI00262C0E52|nr:hypothetical protein [uncultured Ruegeria sp.]